MKNNKGFSMIEMLAVMVIIGILVQVMVSLFIHANMTITKLNKAIAQANAIQLSCANTCSAPPCASGIWVRDGNSNNYKCQKECDQ